MIFVRFYSELVMKRGCYSLSRYCLASDTICHGYVSPYSAHRTLKPSDLTASYEKI